MCILSYLSNVSLEFLLHLKKGRELIFITLLTVFQMSKENMLILITHTEYFFCVCLPISFDSWQMHGLIPAMFLGRF